jgi:hypothetical protein
MHVRWERRIIDDPLNRKSYRMSVFLVENYVEEGKMKERLIDHLGAIEERFLNSNARDMRAFHQGLFWAKLDKKLDSLKLSTGERDKIEAEISEMVPRPAEEWPLWAVTCVPQRDS